MFLKAGEKLADNSDAPKMPVGPKRVQPSRDTDLKRENKWACSRAYQPVAAYAGKAVELGGRD